VSQVRFARWLLFAAPILFICVFLLVPLALTFTISVWERSGFTLKPGLSLDAYKVFFSGVRLSVLRASLGFAAVVTVLGLLTAYPIAYFLALRVSPRVSQTCLFLFAVPSSSTRLLETSLWPIFLVEPAPSIVFLKR